MLPYRFVRWLYGFTLVIDGIIVLVTFGLACPDLSLRVWELADFSPYSDLSQEIDNAARERSSGESSDKGVPRS